MVRIFFLIVVITLLGFSCFAQDKTANDYRDWQKVSAEGFSFYIPQDLREPNSIYEPRKAFLLFYLSLTEPRTGVTLYKEFPQEMRKIVINDFTLSGKTIETKPIELKGAAKAVLVYREYKRDQYPTHYEYRLEIEKKLGDEPVYLNISSDDPKLKATAEKIIQSITID